MLKELRTLGPYYGSAIVANFLLIAGILLKSKGF